MVLAAFVAVSMLFECQVAPWRANVRAAIRDSADVVVDGDVIGVRSVEPSEYGPGYLTAYDVTLQVRQSWLQRLDSVVTIRVENIECDPNPEFLRRYILGLKKRDYGWWVFTSPDPSYADLTSGEVQEMTADWGAPLVPSGPKQKMPRLGLVLAGLTVLVGVGAGGYWMGRSSTGPE